MKEGDSLRAQRISHELDELDALTSPRPKADTRMDTTHPSVPSSQHFVAPPMPMEHNVDAVHAPHSVPNPKSNSEPVSAEGVASRPGEYHSVFPRRPMESSQAPSAAQPQFDARHIFMALLMRTQAACHIRIRAAVPCVART